MDNRKRYQVFISSTFVDLEDERGKVMETILNFDCFPAGMELFPAMDEEQFEYIKRIIDDSDYYLLIIGGRYGSVDESGVSWTEREYDYAVSKGVHVMVFDHKDFTKLPADKTDQDNEKRVKLVAFKKKASKGRLIGKWTNADDLALAVAKSLPKVLEQHPGKGWMRVGSSGNVNSQKEDFGLIAENSKYLNEIVRLNAVLRKEKEEYIALKSAYQHAAQQEIDRLKEEIEKHQNEVKNLQANVINLESFAGKQREDYLALESKYQASQEEIDRFKKEIEKHQNEVKRLDAALKQKEGDYQTLKLSCRAAQQEIDNLNGQITNLNSKLEKLKKPSVMIELQTMMITIPGTDVSFKMVHVEGGTFMMGANDDDKDARSNEKPAHEVTLSDYWIGETQVTQELWRVVMGKNPSRFNGEQNLPVESVSWIDCQKFVERLNKLTNRTFHLPTEAQWEFAARGGNLGKEKGNKYAGRNYDLETIAWYVENSKGKTHPVAQLLPNQLGLYDMSGNVGEWCQDYYDIDYYNNSPKNEPKGPVFSVSHVCRGGQLV